MLAKYDLIQINPLDLTVHEKFRNKVAIVDKVTSFGCQAYVDTFEGQAFIRLNHVQFTRVGALTWITNE